MDGDLLEGNYRDDMVVTKKQFRQKNLGMEILGSWTIRFGWRALSTHLSSIRAEGVVAWYKKSNPVP